MLSELESRFDLMLQPHMLKPRLTYRIAGEEDLPYLIQLREECGWGIPKLKKEWNNPDYLFCVLELEARPRTDDGLISGLERQTEDVGMACWVLQHADPDMASRDTRTVYLSSLYIRDAYQKGGLGTRALQLLERVAKSRFNAEWITLDTVAYHTSRQPDGTFLEDLTRPGRTLGWYGKQGYIQFKDIKPLFPHPIPDNPDRLLWATFLRKSAADVPDDGRDHAA